MNALERVFEIVSGRLAEAGIDCVLIGGFAVNHHGYTRNTLDVDFMIAAEDLLAVRRIMVDNGFVNVTSTENAVFFSMPGSATRADFLQVDAQTMRRILDRAVEATIGGRSVRVPALMDLLAMKLFAAEHAAERRWDKDLADVAHLSRIHKLDLEEDLRPLCEAYASDRVLQDLASRLQGLRT